MLQNHVENYQTQIAGFEYNIFEKSNKLSITNLKYLNVIEHFLSWMETKKARPLCNFHFSKCVNVFKWSKIMNIITGIQSIMQHYLNQSHYRLFQF